MSVPIGFVLRNSVDVENSIAEVNAISSDADQAFDQGSGQEFWMGLKEDDDITALR